MNLPLYEIRVDIDDANTGIDAIALVERPAVEVDFLKFKKDAPQPLKFSEDRHVITGVAMLADTPIYRRDNVRGEYYITFPRETILTLVEKMSRDGLLNSVNKQHNNDDVVTSCVMIESYIKDSERGIVPEEFATIPDGSWIVSYKVEDDDLWQEIKTSGELNGFSIQGCFDIYATELASAMQYDRLPKPIASMTLAEKIDTAIDRHYLVNLRYKMPIGANELGTGDVAITIRNVAVVARGVSSAGNDVFRAYCSSGESHSGKLPPWRLFRLDRVLSFSINTQTKRFDIPFDGYNFDGDDGMAVVYKIADYTEKNIERGEQGKKNLRVGKIIKRSRDVPNGDEFPSKEKYSPEE